MSKQTFVEKCYKNDQGKITIAEPPNLPILVWLVSVVLQKIISNGTVHDIFVVIGFGAIFTWAWLEVFQGTNYFRRLLGVVVIVAAVYSRA